MQRPPSRAYHVENYRLRLRFDPSRGEVFGDEVVTLRPFAPGFARFYLDSSGLAIASVALLPAQGAPVPLRFAARDPRLWITLDRAYSPAQPLRVRIVYHGFPRAGLFFVNPTRHYPQWPREVYSQGEPEFNHYWFPCWDYPNDMATSETITTVPAGLTVVSNGRLVGVTRAGGEATYDWVESVPHSSYLISIAAGPWRQASGQYDGKPVDDYVPRSVDAATARRSFHLTPDMLAFFSRMTGVAYPYEQYAQTTVHNYIFGGQENASATTLTDNTLHGARADADYPSTSLVSHELGQQWTGDYVQGRDWANIWLNEGLATFLDALYTQHHSGYDAYRYAIHRDQLAEQAEGRNTLRPLVDRHYTDPLQMFDAITHEKGAAVMDMLRYVLDGSAAAARPASQSEPLFQALRQYLRGNAGHAVGTAALFAALRSTTGQEYGWFEREWVLGAGHPDYRVAASYDAARQRERVTVAQTQRAPGVARVFRMPIELAFHGAAGEHQQVEVRDQRRRQEFDIPLGFAPQWVAFDPGDFLDKRLRFPQPLAALAAEAERDPAMMSRLWAAQQLGAAAPANAASYAALRQVLAGDRFYGVRAAAAASLGRLGGAPALALLLPALRQQPDHRVRAAVVAALGRFSQDAAVREAWVQALHHDPSYAVEAAAAVQLGRSGAARALAVLQAEAATQPEVHVLQATLDGLAATHDPRAAATLLAQAQPGVPERIRLHALAGLGQFQRLAHDHPRQLAAAVRAALDDPFYLIQAAGEQLAGAFDLTQFRADIQAEAQGAAMAMQRDAARQVLRQWHRPPPQPPLVGAGPSAPAARVPLVSRPAVTARGGMLAPTRGPRGPKSALRFAGAAPDSFPGGGPPCGITTTPEPEAGSGDPGSQPFAPILPAGKAARPPRRAR